MDVDIGLFSDTDFRTICLSIVYILRGTNVVQDFTKLPKRKIRNDFAGDGSEVVDSFAYLSNLYLIYRKVSYLCIRKQTAIRMRYFA